MASCVTSGFHNKCTGHWKGMFAESWFSVGDPSAKTPCLGRILVEKDDYVEYGCTG